MESYRPAQPDIRKPGADSMTRAGLLHLPRQAQLTLDAGQAISVSVSGSPAGVCEAREDGCFELVSSEGTNNHNRLAEARRVDGRDGAGSGAQVCADVGPIGVTRHFSPITVGRMTLAPGVDFDCAARADLQSRQPARRRVNVSPGTLEPAELRVSRRGHQHHQTGQRQNRNRS